MRDGLLEHRTAVKGTTIYWVETGAGSGAPFVLLHGWGGSVIRWLDAMPMLGRARRTIAIDLPGFGRSDVPRGSYSPGWLAGAVRALLDEIGVERAVLVGNSLGALSAMHFAAAWPERVEAVVAVGAALPNDGPQPPLATVLGTVAVSLPGVGEQVLTRAMRREPEAIVAESLERNCADPTKVSARTVEELRDEVRSRRDQPERLRAVVLAGRRMLWELSGKRELTWRLLRSLTVPVLYLWGEQDRLMPVHIAERAVRETPNAHLVVLPDCGHNPQLECAEEFAGAVIAFARAMSARPT